MTTPPHGSRLARVLGAPPPPGVAALPAAAQHRLADLLERALRHQSSAIEAAFERTVRHVPFPGRRIVRKALFG